MVTLSGLSLNPKNSNLKLLKSGLRYGKLGIKWKKWSNRQQILVTLVKTLWACRTEENQVFEPQTSLKRKMLFKSKKVAIVQAAFFSTLLYDSEKETFYTQRVQNLSCKALLCLLFTLPCPLYHIFQNKNNVKGLNINTTEKCAAGSSEQRPCVYQGVLLHSTKIKSLQMYNTRWLRCVISVLWTAWLRWNGLGGKKKEENIEGDFADHNAAWGHGGVMEWEGSRSRGIPSIGKTPLPATEPQRATSRGLSCCVLVNHCK